VSVSPATPPRELASRRKDAALYGAHGRLRAYPRFPGGLQVEYPRQAYAERRQGTVLVQLLIDEKGRVVEALAFPGADPELERAALAALRRARFSPAETAHGPVKARAYFYVSFVIE